MSRGAKIADWVTSSPIIDGVLLGSSDGEVEGPPVCAVAVARGFRGFGKGVTQSDALGSAVGEALEQYAASQVRPEHLLRAPLRELEGRAFDPRWLCLYSEEQYSRLGFPYRRFNPDRPLHWVRGRWLDTGEPVYLPAFAVWLASNFEEETLCQVTSNGLAAGSSVEDAANRAALELYERDAFLSSWIALKPKDRVSLNSLAPAIVEIVEHVRSRGAYLEVYLLESGTPAFVAVCVGLGDGHGWPAVTLGIGAGQDRDQAVSKAILEHGQTGPLLARIWRNRELPTPRSAEDIRTLRDHALYYCDPCHAAEFKRWRDAGNIAAAQDRRAERRMASPRPRLAIADLTPPDLEDSPFRVVRALACGLQPIWCGHGFERSFTTRLHDSLNGRDPNLAPLPVC